jgi:hypothetical protein
MKWLLPAVACAVLLAAPVSANTCGPNPQCDPDDPTTGPCCNASTCTWAATNDICTDPTSVCHTKKCSASHTCTAGTQREADPDTPCYPNNNQCIVGECDGNAHCLQPSGGFDNRCADTDPCTQNICNTDGSGTFTGCDFSQPVANGGGCSSTENGVCTVKTCQNGACVADDPPKTVTCTPSGDLCNPNLCVVNGQGNPVCQVIQQPKGTPCDANPLDCEWQRCKDDGTCGHQAAPNAADCDTNTGDDPSHCQLGQCNPHKGCLGSTSYPVASGVTSITVGGPAGPVPVATCASDSNSCTSDECNGSGSCQNRCLSGQDCGQSCSVTLHCTQNGSSCTCQ